MIVLNTALLLHYLFIVVLISSSVSHSDEVMKKKVSCFAKISYAIGTKIKISNKKKLKMSKSFLLIRS
jgi:hypothetical protein